MKKPEKKINQPTGNIRLDDAEDEFNNGYNSACDDWEKYHDQEMKKLAEASAKFYEGRKLPSEEEIVPKKKRGDNEYPYSWSWNDCVDEIERRLDEEGTG